MAYLLFCVLLLMAPAWSTQDYMHEKSEYLYTLKVLYRASPIDDDQSRHCEFPNFCDIERHMTTSRICNNRGTCMFDDGKCHYWCDCHEGYSGIKCQTTEHDDYDDSEPQMDDIFNETAFGVMRKDYDYSSERVDTWERRRSTSTEMLTAETCEIVDHGNADGTDPNCPEFFTCVHGTCHMQEVNDTQHGAAVRLNCSCDAGWVGERCELCCDLACKHGHCLASVTEGKYCQCDWNWEGELCDIHSEPLTGHPEPGYNWLVIGVGVAALLTLLAMPVLLYYMWRHRVPLVLRLVRPFQKYEDSDEKQFDVFVSYRSCPRDESFVVHHLYPKLELEHNFRLCLHFRDFEPGETIANNIIRAIHSSRRTILVLSPSYITSEWAQFEYQVAQHEMLKLRHRIIPIILDDISHVTNMDANLEAILRAVTFIKYPGIENSKKEERFWRKVVLSLPKKRNVPPAEATTSSAAVSMNNLSTSSSREEPKDETVSEVPPSSLITSV